MRFLPLLLAAAAPVLADTPDQGPEPDLFRKNAQVFSVNADFLYWWVEEGALDVAHQMSQDAARSTNVYANGKAQSVGFNAAPGFRVTTSFFRARHYWELKATYTHLRATGSDRLKKPDNDNHFLTGNWPQIFSGAMTQIDSNIALNYNSADFSASRVFITNPHLRLRLIGGATAAWMDQSWRVVYRNAQNQQTNIRNNWGFGGAGMKMGTMIDWYWTGELYFTAGMSLSGLIGSYKNQAKQEACFQVDGGTNPSLPLRNATRNDIRGIAGGQIFLGPSIQHNFENARMEIFLGYEVNGWANLQEVHHSTAGAPLDAKEPWSNEGALVLHGLIFRTTVDF